MSETDTLEQVELVVDLDDVLRCNHPRGCDRPAEWVYHCRGCGNPALGCTPHKQSQDLTLLHLEHIGRPDLANCRQCGHPSPIPLPWSSV